MGSIGLFDSEPHIIGGALAADIRTTLDQLISGVVSASPDCPVDENRKFRELDVHMDWNSIPFYLLGA